LQELALNNCFSAKVAITLFEAKTEKADKRVGHVWIKEMSESKPSEEAPFGARMQRQQILVQA
jgi:hypothetical protein